MFSVGDVVQQRTGGPKLKVLELNDDQIVAVPADNGSGEKVALKAADVERYKEDGDFGVC